MKRAFVGGCVAFTIGYCAAGLTGIAWLLRQFTVDRRRPQPY